jgi:hypothetical protein
LRANVWSLVVSEPALRDGRKKLLLLVLRAVAQEGAHDIHLRVADGGVSGRAVDLFQDQARFQHSEPAPAVLLGDEGREPAALRQGGDELRGIAKLSIELLPVFSRKALDDFPDRLADLLLFGREAEVHGADSVA